MRHLRVFFDAAVKAPVPNHAGIGVVAFADNGVVVYEHSAYIGLATTPEAEYHACRAAVAWAVRERVPHVDFFGDAELIVRQIQLVYACRAANLLPLYEEVRGLLRQVPHSTMQWVSRKGNRHADRLSRVELDRYLATSREVRP